MMRMRRIYETFLLGDPLSDAELQEGITFFGELSHLASQVGPTYKLVARDAAATAATMSDYMEARKRHKQK